MTSISKNFQRQAVPHFLTSRLSLPMTNHHIACKARPSSRKSRSRVMLVCDPSATLPIGNASECVSYASLELGVPA